MKTSVFLKTAAAALVAVTVSGGALAQSETDRIKALEQMIQKQQDQIESQQKILDEMRSALKSVQESGAGDGTGRNRVVLSRDDKVKLSIEGQVNRALLYYNEATKTPFVTSTTTHRRPALPSKAARRPGMI